MNDYDYCENCWQQFSTFELHYWRGLQLCFECKEWARKIYDNDFSDIRISRLINLIETNKN